jgi:hypothetical protein
VIHFRKEVTCDAEGLFARSALICHYGSVAMMVVTAAN